MDDRRFDAFTRSLAQRGSRRGAIETLLGLGGLTAVGTVALDGPVEAARRPTPTPKPPTCPGIQLPCGADCCCPAGNTKCGPDCCPNGQAECCDNACCYGICYGEELCCPTGQLVCNGVCLPPGGCCTDADCSGARCQNNVCVAYTPTNTATSTPTDTPTHTPTNTPTNTPTDTPTNTATATSTNTPTDTPTNTPVPPTNTPSDTPTNTPTDTPTNTAVPPTNTPTNTPLPAPTIAIVFGSTGSGGCRPAANLSGFPPLTSYTVLLWVRGPDTPPDGIIISIEYATTNANGNAGRVWFFADIPKDIGFEVQVMVQGVAASAWTPILSTSC